jgi:hypothetical protein
MSCLASKSSQIASRFLRGLAGPSGCFVANPVIAGVRAAHRPSTETLVVSLRDLAAVKEVYFGGRYDFWPMARLDELEDPSGANDSPRAKIGQCDDGD